MNAALADLIRRMTIKEEVTDSSRSASWHAYREAERLADPALVPEIQALVRAGKSKDERKAAYFILGALGANTSDPNCALVLSERITQEKDKYVLAAVLEALARMGKPREFDLAGIFACISDSRWLVRHAAIRALGKTDSPEVEERLIAHLGATEDAFDRIYCHVTLGSVGSAKSLPALQLGLASRKRDVKDSAEAAIRAIQARLVVAS